MNRRGFLATLAGAILGSRLLGPLRIQPSAEAWAAAPELPIRPFENCFIPLQTITAETIKILSKETEWLRMDRFYEEGRNGLYLRHGDTVMVRERPVFIPQGPFLTWPPRISEYCQPVSLVCHAAVEIKLEPDEIRRRPLPEFHKRHIEPHAHILAERFIDEVRFHGGGEYLVSVDSPLDIGADRAAVVLSETANLSIRGVHVPRNPAQQDHESVYLDMLFGVGKARDRR